MVCGPKRFWTPNYTISCIFKCFATPSIYILGDYVFVIYVTCFYLYDYYRVDLEGGGPPPDLLHPPGEKATSIRQQSRLPLPLNSIFISSSHTGPTSIRRNR